MPINQSLANWVRNQVLTISEKRGKCVLIALRHAIKKGEDVANIDVPPKVDEEEADALADLIDQTATDDANGLGGLQKYSVTAYHEKTKERPTARFCFRIIGEEEGTEEESDIPDTSKNGIVGMLLKHLEKIHTTMLSSNATIINRQGQMLEGYQRHEESTMEMRFKMVEMVEGLMSQHAERMREDRAEEKKQERFDDLYEKLKIIAPHAINKIAGMRLLPEPETVFSSLSNLRKALTPDEVQRMMAQLPPEKAIALVDALSALDEEGQPHKDEKKKPSNGNGKTNGKH